MSYGSTIQNDKEVAKELLVSLKEDTSKVSALNENQLYSLQMESGRELISNSTFGTMGLKEDLVKGMYSLGLERPSLIQNLAIPHIINGKDAAFQSKSGTGKTIAFTVGVLQKAETGKGPQILILTPTRELCIQVGNVVEKLAGFLGLKTCYALRNFIGETINEEIVVGCPGKVIGLFSNKALTAETIQMIVLDEADELISNQAFGAQTLKLLKMLEKAQKIFFSATYSDMSQKALVKLAPSAEKFLEKNEKAEKIQLFYIEVPKNKKIDALKTLFEYLTIAQTIVFVGTKHMADMVAKTMTEDGFSISLIHGNLMPEDRDAALNDFLHAKTKILVTTNVFSRGMDIPQVNLIINFDIPNFSSDEDQQTYIHRIGRSGRFNRSGFVVDFVSGEEDLRLLGTIQSSIGSISKKFTLDALKDAFVEEDLSAQ